MGSVNIIHLGKLPPQILSVSDGEQKWVILAQILPHSFDKSRCIRRPDFVIAVERKGHVTYWKTSPTHSTL
jgi:hypothetical protein